MTHSDANPWPMISKSRLTAWRKLRLRKERETSGHILIEGLRLVSEALTCKVSLEAILVADDPDGRAAASRLFENHPAHAEADTAPPAILRVGRSDFAQLTDTVHTSGIAAVVGWRPLSWDELKGRRVRRALYCDRISDPGNLGTLIRTAGGLGLDAVLVSPESVETANPKVARSTAGALFRIPVVSAVIVGDVGDWAAKQGCAIFLADATHRAAMAAAQPTERWVLAIGGETQGLSPEWEQFQCQRIGIKMARGVESFNAGVAGALLMDRLMGR